MKKLRIRNIDQGAIMKLNKILKNTVLVIFACLALSACATSKKTTGAVLTVDGGNIAASLR